MGKNLKEYFDEPIYVVVMRYGENLSDNIYDKKVFAMPYKIMGIYANEDDAIKRRDLHQREANENGFGDCDKYYVEPWLVHEPNN